MTMVSQYDQKHSGQTELGPNYIAGRRSSIRLSMTDRIDVGILSEWEMQR